MRLELMYRSVMAPELDPVVVADIVRRARTHNRNHSITGLLVFDGERFCQYLEGAEQHVAPLAERIEKDQRHTGFDVLHRQLVEGPPRFPEWNMAYGLDTTGLLANLGGNLRGRALADHVQRLSAHLGELDLGTTFV